MMRRRQPGTVYALLFLFATLAAACGGGSRGTQAARF